MKNACKYVIWWKRKGIKVLPNIDEENLGCFDHEKEQKKNKNEWGIEEIDKISIWKS